MEHGWKARPWLARILRATLFVAPGVAAWLAVVAASPWFLTTSGVGRIPAWVAQALVVSFAAAHVVGIVGKRFVPLTTLLSLTLLFPDEAPSRFGVALRSGSTKKLKEQAVSLPATEGAAATRSLELVAAMNAHDRLTRGHMERVRAYTEVIGSEMGLSEKDLNGLRWGSLLHDVGKLNVPAEILQKNGKPTEEEWAILRSHPAAGVELLAPLSDFLGEWIGAAADHHERWDGTGYPAGKSGTDISLAGRICSVADAYDVITSKRSYKEKSETDVGRHELARCAGTQFDPVVVRSFLRSGIRPGHRLGRFGWLLELPRVLGSSTGSTIPVAMATAATATVAAIAGAMGVPDVSPPEQLAFEAPAVVVEIEQEPPPTTITAVQPAPTTTTTAAPLATTTSVLLTPAPTTTNAAPTTTTTVRPAPTTTVRPAPTTTVRPAPTTTVRPAPTTTVRPTPTTTIPTTTTTTTPTTTTTTTTTTTIATPTVPTGTGFVIDQLVDGISLVRGQFERNSITLFQETGPISTSSSIGVLDYRSGQLLEGDSPAGTITIPAGTTACSYILHLDPVGLTAGTFSFRIDFGNRVLGITSPGNGNAASPDFDLPDTNYLRSDGHILEASDMLRVEGTVVEGFFLTRERQSLDRIRVITSC